MTNVEAEYDAETRDWILAFEGYEAGLTCSVCGGPKSECQDPGNAEAYLAGVEDPVRCQRMTALLIKREQHAKDEVRQGEALIWELPDLD